MASTMSGKKSSYYLMGFLRCRDTSFRWDMVANLFTRFSCRILNLTRRNPRQRMRRKIYPQLQQVEVMPLCGWTTKPSKKPNIPFC